MRRSLLVIVTLGFATIPVGAAEAAPAGWLSFGRTAVLLSEQPATPQQQEEQQEPPPVSDPAGGAVFSILGGSVLSGASSFQGGAAIAYFFGDKARIGFEVEGAATFGPGGRVTHGMASLVIQAGARTSKFVPYGAVGGGFLTATTSFPTATEEVLRDFGISPEPTTESGPFVQYGGGVRFYVTPTLAFRGDFRFMQVVLDVDGDKITDRLFPVRRIAGMLSWDF